MLRKPLSIHKQMMKTFLLLTAALIATARCTLYLQRIERLPVYF